MFAAHKALDVADYALAGGGFPINVAGAGVIGTAIVSGLPQREDHNLVVRAIVEHLGQDPVALACPQHRAKFLKLNQFSVKLCSDFKVLERLAL